MQPADETMTLQEVWEAAGGNPGIKPTRSEVIEALRQLDEVCDEAVRAAMAASTQNIVPTWADDVLRLANPGTKSA